MRYGTKKPLRDIKLLIRASRRGQLPKGNWWSQDYTGGEFYIPRQ